MEESFDCFPVLIINNFLAKFNLLRSVNILTEKMTKILISKLFLLYMHKNTACFSQLNTCSLILAQLVYIWTYFITHPSYGSVFFINGHVREQRKSLLHVVVLRTCHRLMGG